MDQPGLSMAPRTPAEGDDGDADETELMRDTDVAIPWPKKMRFSVPPRMREIPIYQPEPSDASH
eukprot:5667940-Amphidinium_carterae.1